MKTKKELNILKEDVNNPNKKLEGLNEEELVQVVGGVGTEDRADIQKEIDPSIPQIDDNVLLS